MSQSIHLIVIIHGLWGTLDNLACLTKTIKSTQSNQNPIEIFTPTQIQYTNSYDGIDFCAELVLNELDEKIHNLSLEGKSVTKFSCIGYSLGGLISRFLIGLLHSRSPSFFTKIEPMNLTTFASPWIGIPHHTSIIGSIVHFFGSRSLSRTGQQLYLTDQFHTYPKSDPSSQKYPLIALLAHPDTNFYKALLLFKQIRIYSNAVNDRTVPFVTGAVEENDVFHMAQKLGQKFLKKHKEFKRCELDGLQLLALGGLDIKLDPDYSPIIQSCTFNPNTIPSPTFLSTLTPKQTQSISRYLPSLPFFFKPSTYPFKAPYNYIVAVISPILVPVFITYVLGTFFFQSRNSKKRIKKYSVGELGDHSRRLKRVGLLEEIEHEMIEELSGLGSDPLIEVTHSSDPDQGNLIELGEESRVNPKAFGLSGHKAPMSSGDRNEIGTQLRILSEVEEKGLRSKESAKESGLTALHLQMIHHLDQIPGVVKHFALFHEIRHSHGAIIYRAMMNGTNDSGGRKVVKHWVDHFLF